MDKIKIILSGPKPNTVGLHSNYISIGIGYTAPYIIIKFFMYLRCWVFDTYQC